MTTRVWSSVGARYALPALLATLLATLLCVPTHGLPAQDARRAPTASERALFRLEDAWARAVVARDARALSRMVAGRWVYTDESGVMERDAGIRAFTTGTDTVTSASNSEMRAMVYPGAAVVIGVLRMDGRDPKGAFSRRYRFTDTWVRIGGRWQCVASQDYLMPK